MENQSGNKRIAKNTMFLYVRMLFVLFVSLYTSRVVLHTLGVDDFGVYNVVAGFVTLFGFFNATLSSSMQRFYNYEGTNDKENGYHRVYFTGLIIHIVLAIFIIVLLETLGLWYVNNIMVVSKGRLFAANIVYQSSILSMLFVILQIPYMGAIMAKERMNYYAIISMLDVILKLGAIIILPYLPFDKLIVYAIITLLISLFDFLCYYVYAKHNILTKKFIWQIDKELFRSMLSFSGWNLVGTFAFLLKGQGLNMLLNVYFGPVVNAARGIAYQVNGAINGFSANIATAFRPQIVNTHAEGNNDKTQYLMFMESRVCYALMCLLTVPIILEIDLLLSLWLGDIVPVQTNVFAMLVMIDSLICTLNTPCSQVAFAIGRINKYQIATSIVNLGLLPFSWLFLYWGYDAVSVFWITIIFSIINQFVCLFQLKDIFEYSIIEYSKIVILPCVLVTIVLPVLPIIVHNVMAESFLRFVFVFLTDILMGIVLIYLVVLTKNERIIITQYIGNHLYKIKI